jgi:hypothetical protein
MDRFITSHKWQDCAVHRSLIAQFTSRCVQGLRLAMGLTISGLMTSMKEGVSHGTTLGAVAGFARGGSPVSSIAEVVLDVLQNLLC